MEVIDRIRDVISHCDKPSWLSSVPRNFGDASAGTLKADEWKIMCTVYLPIALVTLWGAGSSHVTPEIGAFFRRVVDNTMLLVSAVVVLCKRATSEARAHKYRSYIAQWLRGLQEIHSGSYTDRTNNHMAFHIFEFLLLFGPVYSWWCFPFERLIGHLQHIPHNDKCGKFSFEMHTRLLSHKVPRSTRSKSDQLLPEGSKASLVA